VHIHIAHMILHGFTIFHAKWDSMQTYVSNFLIVGPPPSSPVETLEYIASTHFAILSEIPHGFTCVTHDIIAHIAHMTLLHIWSKEIVTFTLCTQNIITHIQITHIKSKNFIVAYYKLHTDVLKNNCMFFLQLIRLLFCT